MSTQSTPTIEAARIELGHLLRERGSRMRAAMVVAGILGGLGLLLIPVVVGGGHLDPISAVGGGGFLLFGLLAATGILPASGQGSHYKLDRITYLQAYVAAHDAAAQTVPRPRSRPGRLPETVPETL